MRSLVDHYFRTLLRREPSEGEKQSWGSRAREAFAGGGDGSWHAFTQAFFEGPEYLALRRSDADFVRDLYETLLERLPDAGGLAYWAERMAAGLPRGEVLAQFLTSPECAFDVVLRESGPALRDRRDLPAFRKDWSRGEATPLMPDLVPTALRVVRGAPRHLDVLLPTLRLDNFSGGPNTALALGHVLADRGVPVRFISTDTGVEPDTGALHRHLTALTGLERTRAPVSFVAGNDPARAVEIGYDDVLMGTAWWTVHKFRHCLAQIKTPRFVYLIQEFEPGLYAFSTRFALAADTYRLDHLAVYNHRFLHDFFAHERGAPRHGEAAATWFEPVIDPRHFHFEERERGRPGRQLLFYARPTIAVRNLYELGCAALASVAEEGAFEGWSLHSMGERLPDIELPRGRIVEALPWMTFEQYAARMRACDVLLSLMLSPHPSYPPLEGAASGAIVVTNEYANKTAAAFSAISGNIIATPASVEGIAAGLRSAIARADDLEARRRSSRLQCPTRWTSALAGAADRIAAFWGAA